MVFSNDINLPFFFLISYRVDFEKFFICIELKRENNLKYASPFLWPKNGEAYLKKIIYDNYGSSRNFNFQNFHIFLSYLCSCYLTHNNEKNWIFLKAWNEMHILSLLWFSIKNFFSARFLLLKLKCRFLITFVFRKYHSFLLYTIVNSVRIGLESSVESHL